MFGKHSNSEQGASRHVLLTGASSFTGMHIASALAEAGVHVTCTMTRGSADAYDAASPADAPRSARVKLLCELEAQGRVRLVWGCRFGDEAFIRLINDTRPSLLCHHAADVTDYKSPTFDWARAVANNTANLHEVLTAFQNAGGRGVVLTGSVFEGGEGAGSEGLPHFSPYGLSKALTAEAFRFECHRVGLRLGKFVIPNPFGPLEEPRFTAYLLRTWLKGETARVQTPDYVRDNIHVDLLARCYAGFCDAIAAERPDDAQTIMRGRERGPGSWALSPSGYAEPQGQFARRYAAEVGPRLSALLGRDLACGVEFGTQTEFAEPRVRIGLDPAVSLNTASNWSEADAWQLAASDAAERFAGAPAR